MYRIILANPQNEGNLGFIARIMKNFGFEELYLVNPEFKVGDEARKRAMHAKDILEDLRIENDLEEAIKDLDFVVGTTGITTTDKNVLRRGITPEKFAKKSGGLEGKIGILFGREDKGLSNQELDLCDFVVNIPASEEYPVLNLSHAVGIVLYEIFRRENSEKKDLGGVGKEKDILEKTFKDALKNLNYPERKKETIFRCFRNMIGRSFLFKREAHTLLGALKDIKDELEKS